MKNGRELHCRCADCGYSRTFDNAQDSLNHGWRMSHYGDFRQLCDRCAIADDEAAQAAKKALEDKE